MTRVQHTIECDVIVVGAGSAGCVIAHKIAQSGLRVTLLEPGEAGSKTQSIARPADWIRLLGSTDDWGYKTEPCRQLARRQIDWPRGKGVGGSSRINAMIWFPPTSRDFEMLEQATGERVPVTDWMTTYRQVESLAKPEAPRWVSEASRRFVRAAQGNGNDFGPYQRLNRNGIRWSPASLLDGESRVSIAGGAVDRVVFHAERASGVMMDDGREIKAGKGVVLCAGSIATPMILMRSGIGPADVLAQHTIPTTYDSPRVGANLQDHLVMPIIFSLETCHRFPTTHPMQDLARWHFAGTGPLTSNLAECGGVLGEGQKACQIHVTPTHYLLHPSDHAPAAMTVAVSVCHPESRGSLRFVSSKVDAAPLIEPNYLEHPSDLSTLVDAIETCRSLVKRNPLARWVGKELLPGIKRSSPEAIAKAVARYALTLYHPTSTCAMGTDSECVVDPNFAVRGVERLFVADASVLPSVTTGNPNATVMTVAHRAADSLIQTS